MTRKIQQPDEAVALAEYYKIKGGLNLNLDEVVVPVHIVGDATQVSDDVNSGAVQAMCDAQSVSGGAGQVSCIRVKNPWGSLGRRIRIDKFEISDSGGTAAFFHSGLGIINTTINGLGPNGDFAQISPPGPKGSRWNTDFGPISAGQFSVATGSYPGYQMSRYNKAAGNALYTRPTEVGVLLGTDPGSATGSDPGDDVWWLLNGTTAQAFRVNIWITIFPGPADVRV